MLGARTGLVASPEDFERLIPIWSPLLVLGPFVGGIVMTALVDGRPGFRELRERLCRWRVGARWYAAAVLAGPICYVVASLALSVVSLTFLPAIVTTGDPAGLVARGVIVALIAGIFEEVGWTGFAVPMIRRRHGVFTTGLIVGVVWGLWHFLPKLFGAGVGDLGALWPIDMLSAIVGLTGFRILMVLVYDRTRSLPLAMIMHAGITGSMTIVQPLVTGVEFAVLVTVLAAAPWIVVAVMRAGGVVTRHPVVSYFVLVFTISWGGLLAIVGPSHIIGTKQEFERLLPIAIPVVALGPSLASILLTGLLDGGRGLRALRSRLFAWRVPGRWYAVALLLAPVYTLVITLALSAKWPAFVPGVMSAPDPVSFVIAGMMGALVAGIVEEVGWTGFAIPRLRQRYGAFTTGVFVGVLLGLWHVLPKIWGSAAHDLLAYLPGDLACAVIGLTGFRIVMVWTYDRTGSLLIAVLMHLGLTASTLILNPRVTGAPLMTISAVLAIVPWVIVAAIWLTQYWWDHRGKSDISAQAELRRHGAHPLRQ
jgi:uncharacterized protein